MTSRFRYQLPTVDELRALTRTLRSQTVPDGRERPPAPDDELLALMADPFESVDDVHARLQRGEAYLRARADRRSVFLTVYTAMTAHVEAGIESGLFDDEAWVRDYLVDFADRYRQVLVDFERDGGTSVPQPWALGFSASTGGSTLLIQDALLGINAHINYDLPYTLEAVSIDPDRPAKRADHRRINEVLARLVDVVQEALVEVYGARGYQHVDAKLGSFDEAFTLLGLTEARSLAWRNAVLLTDTRWRWVRRVVDWRIDAVATGAGLVILSPSVDPTVLGLLRQVEADEPPVGDFLDAFQRRSRAAEPGVE